MTSILLQNKFLPAVLLPNPLWIPSQDEKETILADIQTGMGYTHEDLEVISVSAYYSTMRLSLKRLEERIEFLKKYGAGFRKALLDISRVTTLIGAHDIDYLGNIIDRSDRSQPARMYYDGADISSLGHSCSGCIDFEKKRILLQDPQGVEVCAEIKRVLTRLFPEYELTDFQARQQTDVHSCGIWSTYNMELFLRDMEPVDINRNPEEAADIREIRARYAEIIDEDNVKCGRVVVNPGSAPYERLFRPG